MSNMTRSTRCSKCSPDVSGEQIPGLMASARFVSHLCHMINPTLLHTVWLDVVPTAVPTRKAGRVMKDKLLLAPFDSDPFPAASCRVPTRSRSIQPDQEPGIADPANPSHAGLFIYFWLMGLFSHACGRLQTELD